MRLRGGDATQSPGGSYRTGGNRLDGTKSIRFLSRPCGCVRQASVWIDNFSARLDVILDEIQARFPGGCRIFLANIYDPTDGVGDAHHAGLPRWPDGLRVLAAYNRIIEEACARRADVYLVDMRGAFLGHGIHSRKFQRRGYDAGDPHYWYYDILEDPNDRGCDALPPGFCWRWRKLSVRAAATRRRRIAESILAGHSASPGRR